MNERVSTGHSELAAIDTHNPFIGNRLDYDHLPAVIDAVSTGRGVDVSFADGTTSTFHHQWLRHACACAHCGNPADGIRFSTVISFDRDVTPESIEAEAGGVVIAWPDGHRSEFGGDWLFMHAYDGAEAERRRSWRPTSWRAGLAADFPNVSWAEASDRDLGQLRLYETLRDYGIVRVTGLGAGEADTEALAALVGPIHETTVYGRIYDVRAEPVAKLGAKTGMAQAPHIDDAFYYSQPGIDVFHVLANSDDGGMSTYVDGFAIAEAIRDEDPDAWDALTTLSITHVRRHPGEIHLRSRGPLIQLDEFGNPVGVRYFDRAMAPLDVAPADVDRLYDAVRAFNRRMVSPEFIAQIRVAPGDGMLIDNHRVMHGRTAFDPSSGRHIRLCHVPRDEFHGRLRELSHRLRPEAHDLILPAGSGSLPATPKRNEP